MKKLFSFLFCLLLLPAVAKAEPYDIFVDSYLLRMSVFFDEDDFENRFRLDNAICFLSDEKHIYVVEEEQTKKVDAVSILSDIKRLEDTENFTAFALDIQHLYQCTLEDHYSTGISTLDFYEKVIKPLDLISIPLGVAQRAHENVVSYRDTVFTVEMDLDKNTCMVVFLKEQK